MLAIWEAVSPFILPFYYLAIFFVVIYILLDNQKLSKDPLLFAASTSAPYSRNLYLPVFGQNIRKQKVFAKKQLINTAFGGQGICNGLVLHLLIVTDPRQDYLRANMEN